MKKYIAVLLLLSSILAVKAQENGINFLKDTKWDDAFVGPKLPQAGDSQHQKLQNILHLC